LYSKPRSAVVQCVLSCAMVLVQKTVGLALLAVGVQGFRVKPRKQQSAKQVTVEDPVIDESEVLGRFVEASLQMGKSMPSIQSPLTQSLPQCSLTESDCSIGAMSGATLVYTGSDNSRCLNGDPFAFLVKPGRTDKLLFYFPGGGACWKGSFSNAELCSQSLDEGLGAAGLGSGVSADRADNTFGDFTFVAPAYCDGGAFVSNSTLDGKPQNGFANTNFAYEWAKNNMDQTLTHFTIAGSSAGALGTMAWSNYLLSNFQYSKGSVIVDSYMGIFPSNTQGPTIRNFGACNLPIFTEFREVCEAGSSNIQDVFEFAMQSHPSVAFSAIQPKGDIVQIGFYAAIAITFGRLDIVLAKDLYERSNSIKGNQFDRHPNFVHYIIDGSAHTFLQSDSFYSTTVTGGSGDDGKPTLAAWTSGLIEHQGVQSLCKGPLERNGGNEWIFKNTNYCFRDLFPKSLSVA